MVKDIIYVHEPTDLQCGQAVIAMITGISVQTVCSELENERETKLAEMREYLGSHGISLSPQRLEAHSKTELPDTALLSLETPRCWHWSLYSHGTFYDPEHGVMKDFPECRRKYYWEMTDNEK